jgi:large subunit ribosomal protein L14
MLYVQSVLRIVDNTGAFYALCIRILTNSKIAKPGDVLIVSIKSVIYNKKVLFQKKRKVFKGEVRKVLLLRTGSISNRFGSYLKLYKSNCAALIGKWEMPVGNRIFGPVMFEVRTTKYLRIAMLSEGVI